MSFLSRFDGLSVVEDALGTPRLEACKKYRIGGRFPPGPCRKTLPSGAIADDGPAPAVARPRAKAAGRPPAVATPKPARREPVTQPAAASPWRAGAWREVPTEDARAAAAAAITAEADARDAHFGLTSPPGYNEDTGRVLAARYFPPGTRVLQNGHYQIVARSGSYPAGPLDPDNLPTLQPATHPVSDAVLREAAVQLDALVEANPLPGPLMVVFTQEKSASGRANTSAERIAMHGAWQPRNPMDNGTGFASFFMPTAADPLVTELGYHLAHEYGHALSYQLGHTGAAHGARDRFEQDLSPYGRSDKMEGYAEAFAEYFLSAGLSDNPAAQGYAAQFGWRPPVLD